MVIGVFDVGQYITCSFVRLETVQPRLFLHFRASGVDDDLAEGH